MKAIYLRIIIFTLITNFISCKAQQIYPLNADYEEVPQNSYLKDLNNELTPYIGVYKANFDGNETILYITKQEQKLEKIGQKIYYIDALVIKYIVKSSTGTILQDTKNNNYPNIQLYSIGTTPAKNLVNFIYTGTNCNVGWGDIYIKKINSNQISWEYRPDDIATTADKCSPTLNTIIYLPETKDLIFTKQ
ncbi:hypothetical protein M2347_003335 [Chryseobacterium sp. H1D6B]|uniref:DUF6705 family protein n=1 Tax=Chryseobacterium sp. H1D6B TaxID=2940588 RepID=UPI0015CB4838|nr:hypothetical protein [Chryseobacterium sp. H1D6B]MDH6253608.1 hypothetical protein [Chryseobacterium sp. H1D6B]